MTAGRLQDDLARGDTEEAGLYRQERMPECRALPTEILLDVQEKQMLRSRSNDND